jgi:hypothetical protein
MPIASSHDPGRSCVERNGVEAMMGFRALSAAALSGGLLVAAAVAATAEQPVAPSAAIIRFPLGVQFEVPPGWSLRDLQFSPGSNSVVVSYDATRPPDGATRNPNELSVVFNRQTAAPESEQALKSWTRINADRSEVLPNGALARWKIGTMWNFDEVLAGGATLGSTTLAFVQTNAPARRFDPAVLESALLTIAGSMRATSGTALFHPMMRTALDRYDPKRWSAEIGKHDFRLRCEICGQGSQTHIVIARVTNVPFENLDAALAMVTGAHARAYQLGLGEIRRNAIADGAIAWTEQPGSRYPFVGAVKRGTGYGYFFVSISALESMTAGHDDLRNDFLTMAGSVRPWDGR